eukprot:Nitzschia sp. Nitz4//scaffold100_size80364//31920//33143//NITZ4_005342-RA/size80364-processed-gene-0.48-mRNA-1//-1//CDS//3329532088//2249//frame0
MHTVAWMPPIGLAVITSLYLAFCILVDYLAPDCIDDLTKGSVDPDVACQDEGVDNSVIMWAGDFFVAFAAFAFGIHLSYFKGVVRRSGALAQIFMAGAFSLLGIIRWMYPNNGTTDNEGVIEFWTVSSIAYLFFVLSAICHALLAMDVVSDISALHRPCFAGAMVRTWLICVILAGVAYCTGSIWCASDPDLHTLDLHDNSTIPNAEFEDLETCIEIVTASEILLWLAYAFLWVPMGVLFRAAVRRQCEVIWGLSTSTAVNLAVLAQWAAGTMFMVVIAFSAWIRGGDLETHEMSTSFLELWETVHGAEVFHFGMLITLFCAHNIAWTLTLPTKVRMVHRRTGVEKVDTKSFLASKIHKIEEGLVLESVEEIDEDTEKHEPPAADTTPRSSSLKQETAKSNKTVSFG